jgi:tetratricopeptide (TPR) repeat protein
MTAALLDGLEKRIAELGALVYRPQMLPEIEQLVLSVPNIDDLKETKEKVRALLLRGKARLLLPTYSKEVDQDIDRALKLDQNEPASWVALSESYWRRNSIHEARDALESALRVDPKNQSALCQYSRILRSMVTAEDIPAEQKMAYLAEATAKAKESVGIDASHGESWAVYGVALLQETVGRGMELPLMKKALAAFNQAATKMPTNPDVYYNRAAIHQTFGYFGAAIQDYLKAYELDPHGLKHAKIYAEDNYSTVKKASEKMKSFGGMREADFKRNIISKLPEKVGGEATMVTFNTVMNKAIDPKSAVGFVAVKVVDLLSKPTSQPLVYLVADKDSSFSLMLVYRMNPAAIKVFDTVLIPFPPSSAATLGHQIPESTVLDTTAQTIVTPLCVVEPSTLIVNGAPIPAKFSEMPRMGTRVFQ